jgi:predicted permease
MSNDFKLALRQLAGEPGFLAVALLTLALGIGINTTIFSVMNALMLQPLPYPDAGRLVRIYTTLPEFQSADFAPANYLDIRAQSTRFSALAVSNSSSCNVAEPGQVAEQAIISFVSADFFPLMGIPPAIGRYITVDDDRPGHDEVVVISHRFWMRHFGGDPSVLGRVLREDGTRVTVIGVMPPQFDQPLLWGPIDLWRPQAFSIETGRVRDGAWLQVIGRLKPGATVPQAQAEITTIAGRLARDFPKTNAHTGFRAVSFEAERRENQSANWMIMALALSVLLIACANLANLQLVRTTRRVREHAIRLALGATRWQLVRQLLVESLIVAFAGGALGLLTAIWGNDFLGSHIMIGIDSERLAIPLDRHVLAFAFVASTLAGVAFGLIPAFLAAQADVNATLKQGTLNATGDRSRHRVRDALIVAEIALALIVLVGSVFFIRGFQRATHRELGWNPDNLLTGNLVLPMGHYNADQCRAFYHHLEERLAALPGVNHVALTQNLPVFGLPFNPITIEGQPPVTDGHYQLAASTAVSPDYFATLGMRLIRGRTFTAADTEKSPAVVIINAAMAHQLWPNANPLGRRIGGTDAAHPGWQEIVGVVNDTESAVAIGAQTPSAFQVYRPLAQIPNNWISFAVRSPADVTDLGRAAREAVRQIDPDEAIYHLSTARQDLELISRNYAVIDATLATFAGLGLLLSAVGIYGVIANLVIQRTREIGIRIALGAQRRDVFRLVIRKGLILIALGSAIGLAGAWAFGRVLGRVIPTSFIQDGDLIGGMVILLAAVALLACWLPARRATKVDPLIALRAE